MDALDLDHSYCTRCETYIWPEKRQVEVQATTKTSQPVTKLRTVISLDRAPLYCSEKCRQMDLESGSANVRRIMEHFEPSPSSCSPSPVSPSHNQDYFTRIAGGSFPWTRRPSTTSTRSATSMSSMELLEEHRQWSRSLLAESAERLSRSESRAAFSSSTLPKPKSKPTRKPLDEPTPVPFTHRRWKESKDMRTETLSRSIDVDVAALYDQYPMSQRVRSTSSFGSSSSVRRGSMSASTVSDTASICTTSSRGSTHHGSLSADATRGLLVPAIMIRQDSEDRVPSSDEEHDYFVRRSRTITQHSSKRRDQPHKTIQELVRDAAGPERSPRLRPSEEHVGPLYEVTHTPPGPTRRHVVQAVEVDGKEELRIVQEDRWEEPQKLFHFTH